MPEPISEVNPPLKANDWMEGAPPDDGIEAEAAKEHLVNVRPRMGKLSVLPDNTSDLDPSVLTSKSALPVTRAEHVGGEGGKVKDVRAIRQIRWKEIDG